MFKKVICLLAVCVAILGARVVMDSDGKKVTIPDNVERATPMIGAFVQMSAMLGNEARIISGATKLPVLMAKIYPKIRTNFNQSGSLGSSIESIIASKTQVVFGPMGVLFDENTKKQLQAAGIAVVKIDKFATPEQIKQSLLLIAEIFGEQSVKKAKEFNAYFDENIKFVQQKASKINSKKRV